MGVKEGGRRRGAPSHPRGCLQVAVCVGIKAKGAGGERRMGRWCWGGGAPAAPVLRVGTGKHMMK